MDKELLKCKEENLKLKHQLKQDDVEYLNNRIDLLNERIEALEEYIEHKKRWDKAISKAKTHRSTKNDYEPTPDGVAYPHGSKLRNLF